MFFLDFIKTRTKEVAPFFFLSIKFNVSELLSKGDFDALPNPSQTNYLVIQKSDDANSLVSFDKDM